MVNNNNIILDENLKKNVTEVIHMPYQKRTLDIYNQIYEIQNEILANKTTVQLAKTYGVSASEDERKRRDELYEKRYALCGNDFNWTLWNNAPYDRVMNYLEIHFNIPPMTPAVMINISPNWKGVLPTETMINNFCNGIEEYASECNNSRWEKITYVLEDGSDGDFLHFHGVFHVNPDQLNSVLNGKNSHIRKSKHIRQLNKHLGVLGVSLNIQTSILRTELLIEDKIKYLDPENKPKGHENKTKIMDIKTIDFS